MSFSERYLNSKQYNARAIPPNNELLRIIRKAKNISQEDLAKSMTEWRDDKDNYAEPVTQGYISKVESGRISASEERIGLFVASMGGPKDLPNPFAWLICEYLRLVEQGMQK